MTEMTPSPFTFFQDISFPSSFSDFFMENTDIPKVIQSEDVSSSKIPENANIPPVRAYSRFTMRPLAKPVFCSRDDNSEWVFSNECPTLAVNPPTLASNANINQKTPEPDLPIINVRKKRGPRQALTESETIWNLDKCGQFDVKMMKCLLDDCMEFFTSKNDLDLHLDRLHNMLPYRCYLEDCGLSFFNALDLKCHQDSVHGNLTSFTCAYCDQSLNSFLALDLHTVKYHHQGQFTCSACTFFGFTRAEVLNHHMATHQTGYICEHPSCGQSFASTANLGAHRVRAHKPTSNSTTGRMYRCKWTGCNLMHKYPSYIVKHLKRTHLKKNPQVDPKMYVELLHKN